MSDICVAAASPNNCSHFHLTVTVDGVPIDLEVSEAEANLALTPDEVLHYIRLSIRRLRTSGVTLPQFLNRVIRGEEATNLQKTDLMATGSATITKTNIGTAWVNIHSGPTGLREIHDFTGATKIRFVASGTWAGTGPHGMRVVRDNDDFVIYENTNIPAQAGERDLDSDWVDLPPGLTGQIWVRWQGMSATGADDPQYRRCKMATR